MEGDKDIKNLSGGIYTAIFLIVFTSVVSIAFNYNGFNSLQLKVDRTDTMLTEAMGVQRDLDVVQDMLEEL